jgi:hypothetical protein
MPHKEIIELRAELIRTLDKINEVLSSSKGIGHPSYRPLKARYRDLQERIEALNSARK